MQLLCPSANLICLSLSLRSVTIPHIVVTCSTVWACVYVRGWLLAFLLDVCVSFCVGASCLYALHV